MVCECNKIDSCIQLYTYMQASLCGDLRRQLGEPMFCVTCMTSHYAIDAAKDSHTKIQYEVLYNYVCSMITKLHYIIMITYDTRGHNLRDENYKQRDDEYEIQIILETRVKKQIKEKMSYHFICKLF